VTSTLNNYDQRRMLANSIILVDSLNRAGYRSIDIALQARGSPGSNQISLSPRGDPLRYLVVTLPLGRFANRPAPFPVDEPVLTKAFPTT